MSRKLKNLTRTRLFGSIIISGIYFLFGFLWIFFSDKILFSIVTDENTYVKIQTWKGWIYVLLTTVLIYFLLKAYITKKNTAIENLLLKEKELEETLREKEILINELHHRVKNNLQMLGSLIQLKKYSLDNNNPEILVAKLEEQLHALSIIHEKIYIKNQSAFVNMKDFIDDITNSIINNQSKFKEIKLIKKIADCNISLDIAVPYGLIISEALSNAVKHAFVDKIGGQIGIEFSVSKGHYFLDINDNGCGFNPKTIRNRYGLDLIVILSQQLGASASIVSSQGATIIRIEQNNT